MSGLTTPATATAIISQLRLRPHPEGGHYRETFRDPGPTGPDGRAASTAIYFLLEHGVVSRWHRIDAAELWHWYAGAPLDLWIATSPEAAIDRITLGNDILAGQQPQAVVAADAWQQARSRGDWTLVGCTVAPAFQFERFELATDTRAATLAANRL